MTIRVYQPRLTDEQSNEVNTYGWVVHPAYMALSSPALNENAWESVVAGTEYYSHAADVDSDDPNEVFETTNIGPESRITRHGPMRSGSVGDVLISGDSRNGWICLPFGWYEMSRDEIREFETLVPTRMRMGDPIA